MEFDPSCCCYCRHHCGTSVSVLPLPQWVMGLEQGAYMLGQRRQRKVACV